MRKYNVLKLPLFRKYYRKLAFSTKFLIQHFQPMKILNVHSSYRPLNVKLPKSLSKMKRFIIFFLCIKYKAIGSDYTKLFSFNNFTQKLFNYFEITIHFCIRVVFYSVVGSFVTRFKIR